MRFEMPIKVRYSEVNRHGIVPPHQILDYFQDCSTLQSDLLGDGVYEEFKMNRAWYLIGYDIRFSRTARLHEDLVITTEAIRMRRYYGYRRFTLQDKEGTCIADGESLWIYMNTENMLPCKIPMDLEKRYIPEPVDYECSISRKIDAKGDWQEEDIIEVTKYYLDTNNHVNNNFYMLWAESLLSDREFPDRVRIDYRKAAQYRDQLRVYRCQEEDKTRIKFHNQDGELLCLVEFYKKDQSEKQG